MLEGIGLGLGAQLLGLHAEEGATGGREQNLLQRFGAGGVLQALEYGAVFAVHRQQFDAVFFDGIGDQVAAGNKALFIGEGQVVAALNGSQRGR